MVEYNAKFKDYYLVPCYEWIRTFYKLDTSCRVKGQQRQSTERL